MSSPPARPTRYPATEERERDEGSSGEERASEPTRERADVRRHRDGGEERGGDLRRRAGGDEQIVQRRVGGRARPGRGRRRRRARRSRESESDRSSELTFEGVGQAMEGGAHARLHGAERDAEERRDLALREAAPVGELDDPALGRRAASRARDGRARPPRQPRPARAGRRRRSARSVVSEAGSGVRRRQLTIVFRATRVEPRGARARASASYRSADRQIAVNVSCVGILGAAAVAHPAQGEPEHRPGVAPVQLLEGGVVARGDALDQLAVRDRAPSRAPSSAAASTTGEAAGDRERLPHQHVRAAAAGGLRPPEAADPPATPTISRALPRTSRRPRSSRRRSTRPRGSRGGGSGS